jgi:hypothetical protein
MLSEATLQAIEIERSNKQRVAYLRQRLLEFLTPDRIALLLQKLWEHVEAGSLSAIKLLLQYTLGKSGRASEREPAAEPARPGAAPAPAPAAVARPAETKPETQRLVDANPQAFERISDTLFASRRPNDLPSLISAGADKTVNQRR